MKVIAIVGDEPIQRALAAKIHDVVRLTHVARVRIKPSGRRRLIRSAISLTLARGFRRAWAGLYRHYDQQFPRWPDVATSLHDSANDEELIAAIEREQPDLVVVSGTDLLTKRTLERFATKVMNLHTGISPYIRGGPNCTNWALALGEFDLIGNTVLWIDPGIDSGAIIASERTPLTGRETLTELHLKVIEHGQDLYRRAVEAFVAERRLPSVPQRSIAAGRLFYTREWNGAAMIRAIFNHRFRYEPFTPRPEINLVQFD
ncbi:MAG TPA: formyltransferase family protein [Sphingomicrobium sp.]|nr:formyltransferase family protein [Sphingomicrobium sp.]